MEKGANEPFIEDSASIQRLTIDIKDTGVQPLHPERPTFFSLPGELRNKAYCLAFEKEYQRVPLHSIYLNKPEQYTTVLQSCSAVYSEARSYVVENQVAYILVTNGMDRSYGGTAQNYGHSRATKDTIVCALTDFIAVHFHLHLDLLYKKDCNPVPLIDPLVQAIGVYASHSWDLYLEHGLKQRRATVHIDHLLSLWPKLLEAYNRIPMEIF
ncbi:hypothetical protein CC86DRAFT_405956 [Ophiobolus disseminans]|uniref:Uncharacterized protein n=1 Tax=Ophiobolus disseminans TaxID=1469910 RepID=A0A6A7A1L9_9PLEO|nr:hypothetical protein CC86DRAFT_405956 [Ophiobolus disseminans]